MRLYHTPRSRSTRVLFMLEELGAPYELALLTTAERRGDIHRARHPLGRVPVLEDGSGCLFESAAICLQLADLYPDAGLIAAPGTRERGLQYQWAFFAMAELEAPLMDVARQLWAEGDPHQDVIDAARARFAEADGAVVAALGGGQSLVGGRFSVADLLVGGVCGFARRAELAPLSPGLATYVDRIEARPAHVRAAAVAA